jgi:flagellar hook assembly protein FlgD/outer membrane protein OmpA-like peptidoglycan-associated protein
MRIFSLFWAIVLLNTGFLFAQYNPPDGGEDIYELLSPLFLAGGASVVSMESPVSDGLNPAASALQQRISLEASYIGLVDFNDDGWQGHTANLGGTQPTRYGVFTGSLQLLTTSLDDMSLGTLGTLRLSFAKDLFPELLIGSGINLVLGTKDSFDFGLALDLGFIHLKGDFFGLRDFRWGGVLRNMGKWYSPVNGRSSFPSPFTPAVGAGFSAFKSADRATVIGLTGDLALPSLQNLRLSVGADLTYKDRFSIQSALRLDARQIFSDDLAIRSLIPSVGISAIFKTDFTKDESFLGRHGWNRSDVTARVSAAPLHGGIWAFGTGINAKLGVVDRVPPALSIGYTEKQYVSPNLDGNSDALEFPLEIQDERYVTDYRVIFKDSAGNTVRTIENKEKRPENETFQSVMDRLLAVKSGIEIPSLIRWDGIGDNGVRVPDGQYSFVVEARDDNGNLARGEEKSFVIDTTPPKVELNIPRGADLVFSPNDDGIKDTFKIVQSGSVEDLWKAEILDSAGSVVRSLTWENQTPPTFEWDGKNNEGILVPDGIYSYRISSTDRASNKTTAGFDNIFINTEPTPISLSINASFFSPNNDGVQDTVTLTPIIPVTFGLERWELTVLDTQGRLMRRYQGVLNAPQPIVFDGRMENGIIIPEGRYQARLQAVYRNGNSPTTLSPHFTVDLTKPQAVVRADLSVFSPDGDGNKDEITFFQDTSLEEKWIGLIKNSEGRVVKTFSWIERAASSITWNGMSDVGTLVPDGKFSYRLESVDRAGNTGVSNIVEFEINTEETPVILSADMDAFSPNGDGVKDQIRFTPTIKVNEGIESYILSIRDASGQSVRSISGRGSLDPYYIWNGLSQDGKRALDGMYSAEIEVVYLKGDKSTSRTGLFALDTLAPEIRATADRLLFSPDGDGFKDTVTITQTSSKESLWEGNIFNAQGATVRNYFWKDNAGEFTWDGTDGSGNIVADGIYRYSVVSTDRAGNSGAAEIRGIRVDTRKTSAFVTVDNPGFSPNGDGFKDQVEFTVFVSLLDGLESWQLAVKDQGGTARKVYNGTAIQSPMKIVWNGRGDDGSIVEGVYTAEFDAVFAKGNRPAARSTAFLLDITAPVLEVTLNPIPFSPDNDGVSDELFIGLNVKDASPIQSWNFSIHDRNGVLFNRFSGRGSPAERVIWDGRSSTGELVLAAEDYPYVFTVTDALQNTREERGLIPIDILVIRDGERLKIKISSITFAPNSPEVILDNSEKGIKNRSVLERLAEVFTKYGNYNILIEGHANNVTGTQKEEVEELGPLSLARAREVRRALVSMGLGARRIEVDGKGGREMLFPFRDTENNWKNRRVEFILLR